MVFLVLKIISNINAAIKSCLLISKTWVKTLTVEPEFVNEGWISSGYTDLAKFGKNEDNGWMNF